MKYPSKAYSDLVERKQNEIRGNVSSVKLTPQELEAEIEQIIGGATFIDDGDKIEGSPNALIETFPPKKRGWPKGKKRGPRGGKNPFK